MKLNTQITEYIKKVAENLDSIPESRWPLIKQMSECLADSGVNMIFICTHNSRRSHFGQVWSQVLADYFDIPGVRTYSGGTEATAFNHRSVAALERVGFDVSRTDGENPIYSLSYAEKREPIRAWSKVFDDEANPTKDFVAVMTCSEADEACPFIPGAKMRIRMTYEDPKAWDDTDREESAYDERCLQIATEIFAAMNIYRNQ